MAAKMRAIEGELVIDSFRMHWSLVREQCWCTDHGWRGLAIRVEVLDGRHRELQLEYPAVRTEKAGSSLPAAARPKVRAVKVESHIREAILSGWDPESRGKAFVHQVSELPE